MDGSKVVAVITGAIAILISIVYLVVVQLLDFRGEMLPAPMGWLSIESLHGFVLCLPNFLNFG
jgi:hypothetical protein